MRIFRVVLSVLLLTASTAVLPAYAQTDTLKKENVKGITTQDEVDMVLRIFNGMTPQDIILKAEVLVKTAASEKDRIFLADAIYNYYRNSNIMGYDEIAIYFADHYFLNGHLKHPNPDKLLEMKLFSEFNRSSLIGMKGAELMLQDPSGRNISTLNGNQDYTILYFYDDECPNCQRTTPALMQFLSKASPINYSVYMVYTQDDRDRWLKYMGERILTFKLPETVKLFNVWDPDMSSDFPKKYGVISTPQLFLLNREGTIIGRALTPTALAKVVEIDQNTMNAMEMLLEQIFKPIATKADTTEVVKTVDQLFADSKDNLPFFHELFYTTYQYLKTSPHYTLQQGAAYLASEYIVGMPALWETVEFTGTGITKGSVIRGEYRTPKEFIDETALGVKMFYRNMLNRKVTDLTLKDSRNRNFSICGTRTGFTVLYFHSLDCGICQLITEEMEKINREFKDRNVSILSIYTGKDKKWKKAVKSANRQWTDLWDPKGHSGMFDKFDLLDVPTIYLLDKDKKVLAKDINPDMLKELLNYYIAEEE